jgi:hypothetical protein
MASPNDNQLVYALLGLVEAVGDVIGMRELVRSWAEVLSNETFSLVTLEETHPAHGKLVDSLVMLERTKWAITHIITNGDGERVTIHFANRDPLILPSREVIDLKIDEATYAEWTSTWLPNDVQIVELAIQDSGFSSDALEQLSRAQGFLVILNAARILSQREKKLIAALLSGQTNAPQVFFVVNNIHLVEAEELHELKEWVKTALKAYFKDESSYNQRVFYLSPQNIEPLRDRLAEFFSSPAERAAATKAAAAQVAITAVGKAQQHLSAQLNLLEQPLKELQAKQDQLKMADTELREQEVDFTHQIKGIGDEIKFKLYASLVRHLDKMYERWDTEAPRRMRWNEVVLPNMLSYAISRERLNILNLSISRRVQDYLHTEFEVWAKQIPELITPEVEQLNKLTRSSVEMQMHTLSNLFISSRYKGLNDDSIQTMLNNLVWRIALGGREREIIVLRLLMRIVMLTVVALRRSMVLRMSGVLALVAVEAFVATREVESVRKDILTELRDNLIYNLRQELTDTKFSPQSFTNLNDFIQLIGKSDEVLAQQLRQALPPETHQILYGTTYSQADQTQFVRAINTALAKSKHFSWQEENLSPEILYALKHDTDHERVNRLLLATTFPDYLSPKIQDMLNATVDYQLGNLTQDVYEIGQQRAEEIRAEYQHQIEQVQTGDQRASEQREQLQALSRQIWAAFDEITRTVYGKTFSPEEVMRFYAQKQPLFKG